MVMLCAKGEIEELPYRKSEIIELKYDGDRAGIHYNTEQGIYRLLNRRGVDVLFRYPELQGLKLPCENAVIDGELCVIRDGRSVFNGGIDLRSHLKDKEKIRQRSIDTPVTFVAFDILWLNGRAVTDLPLFKRKELLSSVLPVDDERIHKPLDFQEPIQAWNFVLENNEEGLIVKQRDSTYKNGRSPYWTKYKNTKETDIRFTSYEIHPKGLTLTNGKHRVVCNGGQSEDVKIAIDQYGLAICTIRHLGITEAGQYRQPTFMKLLEVA